MYYYVFQINLAEYLLQDVRIPWALNWIPHLLWVQIRGRRSFNQSVQPSAGCLLQRRTHLKSSLVPHHWQILPPFISTSLQLAHASCGLGAFGQCGDTDKKNLNNMIWCLGPLAPCLILYINIFHFFAWWGTVIYILLWFGTWGLLMRLLAIKIIF